MDLEFLRTGISTNEVKLQPNELAKLESYTDTGNTRVVIFAADSAGAEEIIFRNDGFNYYDPSKTPWVEVRYRPLNSPTSTRVDKKKHSDMPGQGEE